MSSELRGCPFCGATELERNDSKFWTGRENTTTRYRIQHHCKDVEGRVYRRIEVAGTTEAEMIAAWNTRAPMELTDSEWSDLFAHIRNAEREFFDNTETPYTLRSLNEAIAKAGRQWLAERSGDE